MKIIFVLAILVTGCARNVDYVKAHATERWAELGYETVGYEGYQWGPFSGGSVWHQLKRSDTPGVLYSGYLQKWGDEIHVYGPTVQQTVKVIHEEHKQDRGQE
jgi:hypothetical protein